jgi:hypothetical protein
MISSPESRQAGSPIGAGGTTSVGAYRERCRERKIQNRPVRRGHEQSWIQSMAIVR